MRVSQSVQLCQRRTSVKEMTCDIMVFSVPAEPQQIDAGVFGHYDIRPIDEKCGDRRTQGIQSAQRGTLALERGMRAAFLQPHARLQVFRALDPKQATINLDTFYPTRPRV